MPLPAAVSEPSTSRLPGAVPPEPPRPSGRFRRRVRAAVDRIALRLIGPTFEPLRVELFATQQHVDELERTMRRFEQFDLQLAAFGDVFGGVQSLMINQDLLKGEIRDVKRTIEELGNALAPGAGIAAAGPRVAELRERVHGIERRLRTSLNDAPAVAADRTSPATAPATASATEAQSTLFDYVGFEQRFRGDPADILAQLEKRYWEVLQQAGPVLDIGCGRGELVGMLAAKGVEAYGIDLDPSLVAEARAGDLDVRHADAIGHLEGLAPHSLGAIVTTHVVEHLQLDDLIRLLELAVSRLRPGGVFIAETPNPASLIVLGNSYILDPTHVRPLHPSLLSFLCESAGFRSVHLEFYAPAEGYWLERIETATTADWIDQINANIEKLNHVLFGPQEYAVIARTPPGA